MKYTIKLRTIGPYRFAAELYKTIRFLYFWKLTTFEDAKFGNMDLIFDTVSEWVDTYHVETENIIDHTF